MVTIAVLWQDVILTEDIKLRQSFFILKYLIQKNLQKRLAGRDLSSYIAISTVIQEEKTFLCMAIIIRIFLSNVEYILLL